jgi:hypothetical protein
MLLSRQPGRLLAVLPDLPAERLRDSHLRIQSIGKPLEVRFPTPVFRIGGAGPIFALTARTMAEDRQRCLAEGCDGAGSRDPKKTSRPKVRFSNLGAVESPDPVNPKSPPSACQNTEASFCKRVGLPQTISKRFVLPLMTPQGNMRWRTAATGPNLIRFLPSSLLQPAKVACHFCRDTACPS